MPEEEEVSAASGRSQPAAIPTTRLKPIEKKESGEDVVRIISART